MILSSIENFWFLFFERLLFGMFIFELYRCSGTGSNGGNFFVIF